MPIETPAGTLEVENAKFRASSVEATIAVGIGTDSNDAYPLQVFKETAPSIRLSEGSTISSAARLYSNNSNLYIQTGTDFSSGSSGDVAFQTMGGQSTHMVIKNDGNVGVGVTNPLNSLIVKGKTTIGTGASTTNSQYHDGTLNVIGGGTRAILRVENNNGVGDPTIILGEGGGFTENTVPTIKKIAGTNNLSIMTAGNVGIGMTNPSAKLHVNGSINHGNYNYISGGQTGGYKDLGNGAILLWGSVIVYVTTANQYVWTWYFPNSLTLSNIYCATAEISDPARGVGYPGAFTLLGVNGLNTNRISGVLKSQNISDGNIFVWVMAIGQKA